MLPAKIPFNFLFSMIISIMSTTVIVHRSNHSNHKGNAKTANLSEIDAVFFNMIKRMTQNILKCLFLVLSATSRTAINYFFCPRTSRVSRRIIFFFAQRLKKKPCSRIKFNRTVRKPKTRLFLRLNDKGTGNLQFFWCPVKQNSRLS